MENEKETHQQEIASALRRLYFTRKRIAELHEGQKGIEESIVRTFKTLPDRDKYMEDIKPEALRKGDVVFNDSFRVVVGARRNGSRVTVTYSYGSPDLVPATSTVRRFTILRFTEQDVLSPKDRAVTTGAFKKGQA